MSGFRLIEIHRRLLYRTALLHHVNSPTEITSTYHERCTLYDTLEWAWALLEESRDYKS